MGDKVSEEDVKNIIHNPVYAGLGSFPRIVSDKEWIEANAMAVERNGKERVPQKTAGGAQGDIRRTGCRLGGKNDLVEDRGG